MIRCRVGDGCWGNNSEFIERHMDYIRDRESNIPFSLHDSRIIQIEINETTLTLRLDRIFQYAGDEEKVINYEKF